MEFFSNWRVWIIAFVVLWIWAQFDSPSDAEVDGNLIVMATGVILYKIEQRNKQ